MKTFKTLFTLVNLFCFPFFLLAQNVGIGTTTPDSKLTVVDSVRNTISIKTLDNNKSTGITFQNSGGAYSWNIFRKKNTGNQSDLIIGGGTLENDINDLDERFKITQDGNTEIYGTTTLDSTVFIEGDLITNGGKAIFNEGGESSDFRIESDTSEGMFFLDGSINRIGINNENPQAVLDVNGSTMINGNFRVATLNVPVMFFVNGNTDFIGIRKSNPSAELDINGELMVSETSHLNGGIITSGGISIFNQNAEDLNFRVKSLNEEFMIFVDAGEDKLGIGTNSPSEVLDVVGNTELNGDLVTGGNSTFNESGLNRDFRIESNGNENMFFLNGMNNRIGIGKDNPQVALDIDGGLEVNGTSTHNEGIVTSGGNSVFNINKGNHDFRIASDNNDFMFVVNASENRIGIGAALPSATLDVTGTTELNGDLVTSGGHTTFNEGGNNKDFRIEGVSKQNLFFVDGSSDWIGLNTNTPSARLDVVGSTELNGKLDVNHGSINDDWPIEVSNSAATNHKGGIRIDDDGYLEITNKANDATPNFTRLNSFGIWTAVSDRRLKSNIRPAKSLLSKTLQLEPVYYIFKSDSKRENQLGFIAQEMQKVFPEFVEEGELLTLNYAGLSVVAIGAIKELNEKNLQLEARIAALENANNQLAAQVLIIEDIKDQIKKEIMVEMSKDIDHSNTSASKE